MPDTSAGHSWRAWWGRWRVLLYLLLGLGAVDVLIFACRQVWRAYDPDEYEERLFGCRRRPQDLVVVGGSPVCEGIDPAVLAGLPWQGAPLERVYNLGLAGATTSEVWHAIEHGLAAPPRLLVYGITATDLNDSRDEPQGPRVLMDFGDLLCWARHRPESIEWCLRHFAKARVTRLWNLFRFRNGIRLWAADCAERLWPGVCPEAAAVAREGLRFSAALHQGNGFAPRPQFRAGRLDHLRAGGHIPPRFSFLEKYRLGGHLAYLHHLLDWAAAHGVGVVLVDMPVSPDLEERLYPQAFAQYRAALADLERQRGVRVLRATRGAVGLGDADFADLIHLNAAGCARLSQWLRRALAEGCSVGDSLRKGPATRGASRLH
jgi:hypothetical protein